VDVWVLLAGVDNLALAVERRVSLVERRVLPVECRVLFVEHHVSDVDAHAVNAAHLVGILEVSVACWMLVVVERRLVSTLMNMTLLMTMSRNRILRQL